MPPSANSEYQRLLLRHSIDLEGFEENLVGEMLAILRAGEPALARELSSLLATLPLGGEPISQRDFERLDQILRRVRELRQEDWRKFNAELRSALSALAGQEVQFGQAAFATAVRLQDIGLATPAAATLRARLFDQPFRLNATTSRTLAEYLAGLRVQDQQRIEQIIRAGFVEGQTAQQVLQSVFGSRRSRFSDGLTKMSANHAESIVRTAMSHFVNGSRAALWEENDDVILGSVWTAVLDGRTTLICQSRDGHVAPVGDKPIPDFVKLPRLNPPNAVPPAHGRCRSILVALISPEGLIGDRPFVIDLRTGSRVDFTSRDQRLRWAQQRVGRVPAKVNYRQFIMNEDLEFQLSVYGPTRTALLRRGGLTVDDLVSRNGRRYTEAELRLRNAEAFRRAGLQ
jgi:hypothetical protein